MHAILSFSSPRCAIIARLNVIYTKYRCAMIAQLNKNTACVGMCAYNHTPLMVRPDECFFFQHSHKSLKLN